MRRSTIPALVLLVLCCAAHARAGDRFMIVRGDTLWLTPPVVVEGTRVPAALPGAVRDVSVLDAADAARVPVLAPAELLALAPAVAVDQRQRYGTQADLSIRGSSFEQVQVLLDGMDVGDPQTGHHAMDLPLTLDDIARLEVLPGHGSLLYGAGAFGGVVDVTPRAPSAQAGGALALMGGGAGTRGGRLRLETGEGELGGLDVGGWVSGSRFETDGDRPGTDADNRIFTARSVAHDDDTRLDLLAGFARRSFGAPDFYAPYPSWERTETRFVGLGLQQALSDRVVIEQRLHGRRHDDRFVLLRDSPDVYANDHRTRRAATDTRVAIDAGHGLTVAMALDGAYEDIDSQGVRSGVAGPALGVHDRRRAGGAVEFGWRGGGWRCLADLRRDVWSDGRPVTSRSAAVHWWADSALELRASAGSVLRVPTFTELYYTDPVNVGNAGLAPERGWTWDAGAAVRRGPWTLDWSVFDRYENDLIDWVRPANAPEEPWRVRNIASGRTRGWTATYRVATPRGDVLALTHTYLETSRSLPGDLVSKYGLTVPRQLLAASATARLSPLASLTGVVRERSLDAGGSSVVVDLRGRLQRDSWSLDLDVANLLDRYYEEVPGVPLPGRQFVATAGFGF